MGRKAVPFWDHVTKSDGCWEWTGALRAGYGRAIVKGQSVRAHRRAWELTNGLIPAGMHVLHRCDNPPCVRPDHLFLGTQADNIRDAMSKGRHATAAMGTHPSHLDPRLRQGINNGNAILSVDDVRAIRERTTGGFARGDLTRLAREYGVSVTLVWSVVHRRSWRHI